jgi:hypothetical protein
MQKMTVYFFLFNQTCPSCKAFFKMYKLQCPHPHCPITFKTQRGQTYHIRTVHSRPLNHPNDVQYDDQEHEDQHGLDDGNGAPMDNDLHPVEQRKEHPHLTGMCTIYFVEIYGPLNSQVARPCDQDGNFLPPGTPPPPRATAPHGDWSPFNSEVQFELADLLYRRAELSTTNVEDLLELWARSLSVSGTPAPFRSCREMHTLIDSSMLGDSPWQCLVSRPPDGVDQHTPEWKRMSYEVWYRNPDAVVSAMLDNPDFNGQFDLRPYIDLSADGRRRWSNVMSGNIAWRRSVSWAISISWGMCINISAFRMRLWGQSLTHWVQCIAQLSSGATRRLYLWRLAMLSIIRCTYRLGIPTIRSDVDIVMQLFRLLFLPYQKVREYTFLNRLAHTKAQRCNQGDRGSDETQEFRTFKRQLYHASVGAVLRPLLEGMRTPVVRRCPDGHFRRVIYDLVAFIADYPEQVMLTGIVQGWCPK